MEFWSICSTFWNCYIQNTVLCPSQVKLKSKKIIKSEVRLVVVIRLYRTRFIDGKGLIIFVKEVDKRRTIRSNNFYVI